MPRLPRLHVPGGFYHVILRGNHRENIFSNVDDQLALNAIVAEAIEKYHARVHAFYWMSNHQHAFLQIHQIKVGKVVQRIAMRYSRYRHKKLRTTGHLFERRHRAFLVDADTYFLTLLRYIHLNPVEACMVASPMSIRGAAIMHIAELSVFRGSRLNLVWVCGARRWTVRTARINSLLVATIARLQKPIRNYFRRQILV